MTTGNVTELLWQAAARDGAQACCAREPPRHMRPDRFEAHEPLSLLPSGKHDLAPLETDASRA